MRLDNLDVDRDEDMVKDDLLTSDLLAWEPHFQALFTARSRSRGYELPSPIQHFGISCGTFSSFEEFSLCYL